MPMARIIVLGITLQVVLRDKHLPIRKLLRLATAQFNSYCPGQYY
jgi:hypothetical protein